jgi:putative Mn2+ efflux pump MntP
MIWLGSHMGYYFSFSSYGYLFQLLVAAVFIGIGVKVLKESLDEDEEPIVWGFFPLVLMAFGTSIDALAAGISLGTLPETHLTALEIGFITFIICSMGYGGAFFLKSLPTNWLLRAASLIFFFLGGQILYQHYL